MVSSLRLGMGGVLFKFTSNRHTGKNIICRHLEITIFVKCTEFLKMCMVEIENQLRKIPADDD